jgi:hypothetical protein
VIASLALSLATVALFSEASVVRPFWAPLTLPRIGTLEPLHLTIAAAAFIAIRRFRVHVVWIVLASAAVGMVAGLVR